jgi:hypothetical protein
MTQFTMVRALNCPILRAAGIVFYTLKDAADRGRLAAIHGGTPSQYSSQCPPSVFAPPPAVL